MFRRIAVTSQSQSKKIYFAFSILWPYSEGLQSPLGRLHKWSACLSEIPCIPPSRSPTLYHFCLLLYLENLYLLSLHLFSFLHFVKLIICISFFWPLALMICPPERNPLYPSFALSSPLYPFYLFLNLELLHFFNWKKSVIFQGFLLSFCAVDLQLLTAVWYKSNKLFLNLENLPNSTKAQ